MTALLKSGDTYTRKGYAVVVRGLSPNNTRRPHSKNDGYGTLCLYPPYETTTEFLA
jgi:hypothetical protein